MVSVRPAARLKGGCKPLVSIRERTGTFVRRAIAKRVSPGCTTTLSGQELTISVAADARDAPPRGCPAAPETTGAGGAVRMQALRTGRTPSARIPARNARHITWPPAYCGGVGPGPAGRTAPAQDFR